MANYKVTTARDLVDPSDGVLSLREAVTQANATAAADTIRFAAGLEGKTLVLARGELVLRHDLAIDGDRDNDGREVTLSGGGESRVLNIVGGGTHTNLRDLELTEARAPADEPGGAILLGGGNLRLSGCTISYSSAYCVDQSANVRGGGIYAAGDSSLTLKDSTIRDCGSPGSGGSYGFFQYGGGIFAGKGCRVSIADSAILRNQVGVYSVGGGIAGDGAVLTVRNSLLDENSSGPLSGGGGAIHLNDSTLLMVDTSVRDNAGDSGGGSLIHGGTATIARSVFSGNSAGAIEANGSSLTLADSTVAGNHADQISGGVSAYGGELVVRNCTITGNAGGDDWHSAPGGGIGVDHHRQQHRRREPQPWRTCQ